MQHFFPAVDVINIQISNIHQIIYTFKNINIQMQKDMHSNHRSFRRWAEHDEAEAVWLFLLKAERVDADVHVQHLTLNEKPSQPMLI